MGAHLLDTGEPIGWLVLGSSSPPSRQHEDGRARPRLAHPVIARTNYRTDSENQRRRIYCTAELRRRSLFSDKPIAAAKSETKKTQAISGVGRGG